MIEVQYLSVIKKLEQLPIMPSRPTKLEPLSHALSLSKLYSCIDPEKVIIVAGTNGKGSICATMSALMSQKKRVGLFTSPHLVHYTERFRINDQDITKELFVELYQKYEAIIKECQLTHFEALTLMAVALFHKEENLDYVLYEVGLGGRLDATNVIPHQFCVIATLGFDHQNILGNTLGEIAGEKMGIIPTPNMVYFKEGCPVIFSPMDSSLTELRNDFQRKTRCRWIPARTFDDHFKSQSLGSLAGPRARINVNTALTAVEELGLPVMELLPFLSRIRWPGRFSEAPFSHEFPCKVFLSGDHNHQGIVSLVEILREYSWRNLHLIFASSKDKDADGMLDTLLELPRCYLYLTESPFKPRTIEQYSEKHLSQARYFNSKATNVLEYVRRNCVQDDIVVITGSLYLVGELLATQSGGQ